MTDILLAHSYFLKDDPKQLQKMKPYPPLATLYAASALRDRGYTVALFDAMLSDGICEFETALSVHRPRFVVLYEDSFNFLVKMCLARMREAAQTMAQLAHEYGATVIAAGPDVTDHPDLYFPHGVHFALLGEADHTLLELVDQLTGDDDANPDRITGLAWADGEEPGEVGVLTYPHPLPKGKGVHRTAERLPERHPDVFPFPAWDLVDVERYRAVWTEAHGYFSINMVSTRGCPFHCNWCAKPIWGQRYAMRTPANVAEELAMVKATIKPDHVWFADDIFGLRPSWVCEFADEVRARDAVVPFMMQSRADLMTEQSVAALAKAGCAEVWMGAESGSQRILDAMEKGTRVAQIATARRRLKDAGIAASFFLQFGYPGETLADIMATVQLVRETLPDNIGVSVSYPLPGTKFHTMVRSELGPKSNWLDSGDLEMLFQGTYQSAFYRHLHALVHRDLDLRRVLLAAAPDLDTLALLDRLNHDWMELGRLEPQSRSLKPTVFTAHRNGNGRRDACEVLG